MSSVAQERSSPWSPRVFRADRS